MSKITEERITVEFVYNKSTSLSPEMLKKELEGNLNFLQNEDSFYLDKGIGNPVDIVVLIG